jgi:hypothetical protein
VDRRIARQVKTLAVTNPRGVPLYMRPEAGNAAELTSTGAALERLAALLPTGFVVCSDSAFGHLKNLCDAERAGLRFVAPLRASSGFAQRCLDEVGPVGIRRLSYTSRRDEHLKAGQHLRLQRSATAWKVTDPLNGERRHFRVACVWSSEEQKGHRRGLRAGHQPSRAPHRDQGAAHLQGPVLVESSGPTRAPSRRCESGPTSAARIERPVHEIAVKRFLPLSVAGTPVKTRTSLLSLLG